MSPQRPGQDQPPAAFYCVVSSMYFLGAVGMINSLRVAGHTEPVFALDCGLSPDERDLLASEATIVPAPPGARPYTLKTHAPLAHPADVMVMIDADMVVTRSLAPLLERAAEGRVVAFENPVDRYVPEWGDLLGLGDVPRRPYLCSGFVAAARGPGEEVMRLVEDRQRHVEFDRGYFGRNDHDYALMFADQDVLNAVLAARVDEGRVVRLPAKLAPMPPFDGLSRVPGERLACRYDDGSEAPYLVHQSLPWKPWLETIYDGVYSQVLRDVLDAPDVAVRVGRERIPVGLRHGAVGWAERQRVKLREQLRWRLAALRPGRA